MNLRVLDAGTPDGLDAWLALWRRWPDREVQGHPEYARLFARPCDRVVCVAGEDVTGAILFPLLLRPLAAEPWASPGEARLDAISPYGYGGPFAWGGPGRDDASFWAGYDAWCREERIVSTFVRLSLFADELAPMPFRVEVRAPNVVVPLGGGPDALWRGYDTRVRKWVRVAERAGLEVEVDREGARLDAFVDVYTHTMERNGADDWYFFPRSFFESIVERLPGQYAFFCTLRAGEVLSSDLVLLSRRRGYYFLGGTHAEAFPLGPNYLLKHRIASWLASEGKEQYVLGGGYEPDDGLIRYKRGFARTGVVPFRVASAVHDERGYRELAEARAAHEARVARAAQAARAVERWAPRTGFFPAYRG